MTLLEAENSSGYFGVYLVHPGYPKPYQAQVRRGDKMVHLGSFATAEAAALCVARTPEGQAAAQKAAAEPVPLTSEEARQQAQAEGLVLRVADNNSTGYFGVRLCHNSSKSKAYQAQVWRGGKMVYVDSSATAEEAALCVARSPEGQAAAAERATAAPPLTSDEARQQAQAEKLTLLVAANKTGCFGVTHQPGRPKPYQAQVRRGGEHVYLGSFVTAEEAALCVARTPEGQAAAEKAAVAPVPLTSEEARQQAQAEKLTLLVAKNKTGYFGVNLDKRTKANPYEVRMRRGGKKVSLGCFATAEEAALHVARSPEGQAAVQKAAAATRPLTSEEKRKGSFVYKEEGLVPPMPPGAYTKVEIVVLKEEESSGSRPKRQRPKKVTALWRRLSSSGSGHGSGTGAWGWAFFLKPVLTS